MTVDWPCGAANGRKRHNKKNETGGDGKEYKDLKDIDI